MKYCLIIISICALSLSTSGQNALNFDGVDDKVNCGNGSAVQVAGNQICLEAWIFPTSWKAAFFDGNIINKESNNPDYGYMLRCGDGGKLNFNLGDGISWNELTTVAGALSLNVWQHVAGTYDGSMMRIYVNGIQIDSLSRTVSFASASNSLMIGNWSDPNVHRTFNGTIDEVRVWNLWRSSSDIVASMNQEFCQNPTGLVAYYSLNEGIASGTNSTVLAAVDRSGNGNNGVLTNFTLNGTTSNWVNGTVLPAVDTSVSLTGATVTCAASNASYLWLDCNNSNAVVPGQIWQTFTPLVNGSYAAQITQNGCTDTSRCITVSSVGIVEPAIENHIIISPNPAADFFNIYYKNVKGKMTLEVYNLVGEKLLSRELKSDSQFSQKIHSVVWPSGLYLVKFLSPSGVQSSKRILIQH